MRKQYWFLILVSSWNRNNFAYGIEYRIVVYLFDLFSLYWNLISIYAMRTSTKILCNILIQIMQIEGLLRCIDIKSCENFNSTIWSQWNITMRNRYRFLILCKNEKSVPVSHIMGFCVECLWFWYNNDKPDPVSPIM